MTSSSRRFRIRCLCMLLAVPVGAIAADAQYLRPAGSKAPYSAAVKADGVVYVSGQLGTDAAGTLPADFDAQARNAMANVATVLATAGARMDDVVQCTVMIVDMQHWASFNAIYQQAFDQARLPARSAMAVSALPMGALVEVGCIAHAGNAPR